MLELSAADRERVAADVMTSQEITVRVVTWNMQAKPARSVAALGQELLPMNTYHIYFDGQCLFKNLTENEFNIIYGKIYSSYFGERITYEVITEVPNEREFEHSY